MIDPQTASVFICEPNADTGIPALWQTIIGGGLAILGGIVGGVVTSLASKKHQQRQARDTLVARVAELSGRMEDWKRAVYERWTTLRRGEHGAPPEHVFKALSEFSPSIQVCRSLSPDKETRDKLGDAVALSNTAYRQVDFTLGDPLTQEQVLELLKPVESAIQDAAACARQWDGSTRS